MKNLLIIVKLILFPYIIFSQGLIAPDLNYEMEIKSDNTLFSVIIEINDEFDILYLKNQFHSNNTPVKKRASIICETMQNIAKETQAPIIHIIEENNPDYKNLKSSWMINAIFLDSKKSLIRKIASHPNIKRIKLQQTQADIIDYIDSTDHASNMAIENGTEPGIEAINVRPLWEMGYTGKGLLVFNYDTGVWPTHPAFENRFFAHHYPMSQCWDGYFSNLPNGHISDHGTHTLGTMAGLVSETNDTIGIAFKSYWIANDFVTSTVETLPPIADMMTSFEWALNPDGDVSTYYDVPDVINNSWRWYNEMDTFQCSGYAVELMNVIEAAGIANIFSAGNNGPNNDGVRSPQRINSNLVNTFCVGSINANVEDYPISSFSCRGPTQCPGEGSLALYPEVVAPGQNVRSAWGQNDYNTISGTSMASPHVSGAVLLLKEAFPFLSGQEILLALYNTAYDLGDAGEDNTFGMGLIDAYAAFNYLANSYTPIPPNTTGNDLVLLEINDVPNKISCETSFSPSIDILNNTDSIIEEIKIYYIDVLNQIEEDSLIFAINLEPYSNAIIQLPLIENNNFGDKEFSFRIAPINTLSEVDYHNNRKMARFKYKPSFDMPFLENFQNGISDGTWHINNDDYYRTWDTLSSGGLNINNISAYVNLYGYNPRAEQRDELIGPNINVTGDSIKMSFQVAYQKYNNSSKQDTLQIFLSTDCGENYNYKIFEKGGQDLSTYDEVTSDFIPQEDNQWREEIIDLTEFLGQEIMLKFTTINLRGNNIFIDDIQVYDSENTSHLNNEQLDFSIHPNPSNNIFELSFNNEHIENIQILNGLGQLIMPTKKIDRDVTKYIIDMTPYQSGLYFITIKTPQATQTMPIIKK